MERPWMPFYVNDYMADTALLSLHQHGAYCLILAHYWNLEGDIPADIYQIYKLCRCQTDEERQAVSFVVGKYFDICEDKIINPRMDEEIRKAKDLSAKRSELGKRGAAVRYSSSNSHSNSYSPAIAKPLAKDSLSQSQSHTQLQTPKKEKPFVEQAQRILGLLNETARKNFRETKANLTPIIARLKDGYTEQDCRTVIDTKTAEWLGGEMEQYLRPSTLFQAQKFDGYLQKCFTSRTPSPPSGKTYSDLFGGKQ